MGHSATFLCPNISLKPQQSYTAGDLDADTQQHMKVLRLRSGENISILDGAGQIFEATLLTPTSFQVNEVSHAPPRTRSIELLLSFPKKETLWEVISQATELGVSKIVALSSQHNQNPGSLREKLLDRAQKISDEACCQCRQPYRVAVAPQWVSLESALINSAGVIVFADETAASSRDRPFLENPQGQSVDLSNSSTIQLVVGPEGGWSDEEVFLLRKHAHRMGLGPNVLRVPTAVAVALYQLQYFANR